MLDMKQIVCGNTPKKETRAVSKRFLNRIARLRFVRFCACWFFVEIQAETSVSQLGHANFTGARSLTSRRVFSPGLALSVVERPSLSTEVCCLLRCTPSRSSHPLQRVPVRSLIMKQGRRMIVAQPTRHSLSSYRTHRGIPRPHSLSRMPTAHPFHRMPYRPYWTALSLCRLPPCYLSLCRLPCYLSLCRLLPCYHLTSRPPFRRS